MRGAVREGCWSATCTVNARGIATGVVSLLVTLLRLILTRPAWVRHRRIDDRRCRPMSPA